MKGLTRIAMVGIAVIAMVSGCKKGYEAHPFTGAPSIDPAPWIAAVNAVREDGQQCGEETIPPQDKLKWSKKLYAIAYEHTSDMNQSGIINPNGDGSGKASDYTAQVQGLGRGSTHSERVRNNDYHPVYIREIATGDSSAAVAGDVNAIIKYWLNDAENCKKIMDANVTEFGMAYIHDDQSKYKYYWTIDLGKPSPKDTW